MTSTGNEFSWTGNGLTGTGNDCFRGGNEYSRGGNDCFHTGNGSARAGNGLFDGKNALTACGNRKRLRGINPEPFSLLNLPVEIVFSAYVKELIGELFQKILIGGEKY